MSYPDMQGDYDRSKDCESDVLNFVSVMRDASDLLSKAVAAVPSSDRDIAVATVLFNSAHAEAQIYAALAGAAAARSLTAAVDDLRRLLP